VRATGTLNGTSIALSKLSARQPDAAGVITAQGTYDTGSGMYTVSLGGNEWQLLPTAEQPLAGRVTLRFDGAGTADAPRGTGTLTVSDAAWQDMMLGTVDAKVELDGQTARVDAMAPQFDATAVLYFGSMVRSRPGAPVPQRSMSPRSMPRRGTSTSAWRFQQGCDTNVNVSSSTVSKWTPGKRDCLPPATWMHSSRHGRDPAFWSP
jgi:hypothetical protein